MEEPRNTREIRVLDPHVARKIAAGEVIERPASIVRELLDNSIDAGATRVTVQIESGGIDLIRVQDDGRGMNAEDLALCAVSHATSKIRSEEDLRQCRSLGFRGEALASIAAVSRLRIKSRPRSSDNDRDEAGALLQADAGGRLDVSHTAAPPGTIVEVAELFYSQPARKRFLKNPAAESKQVRTTLIDKALPVPDCEFRYFIGDDLKLFLPAASLLERIQACYPEIPSTRMLRVMDDARPEFRIKLIAADPGLFRRDKRLLQVFINGRRVQEYAFQQAVEYAYEAFLPGGLHPVCWVMLEIDPELVDFNVHPAKREVRLRNKQELHRAIVDLLRAELHDHSSRRSYTQLGWTPPISEPEVDRSKIPNSYEPQRNAPHTDYSSYSAYGERPPVQRDEWYKTVNESTENRKEHGGRDAPSNVIRPEFRYLGTVFGVFLVVEIGESLLFLDQHAVHERLLYDALRDSPRKQRLLVPVEFNTDPEQRTQILSRRSGFAQLGVEFEEIRPNSWLLTAVPQGFETAAGALVKVLCDDYDLQERQSAEFFARRACRAAVKDGDQIDSTAAEELIRRAFELENPRCPHGRPLWHSVTRQELLKAIGRTL